MADITIRDYYNNFISRAEDDLALASYYLKLAKYAKNRNREYIKENIEVYKEKFGINLLDYKIEWIASSYDNKEPLAIIANKIYYNGVRPEDKIYIIQLIKYCNNIKAVNRYNIMIEESSRRSKLTYKQYREIIKRYYYKVQECLLEGYAYHFNRGLGDLVITRFKANKNRKMCDLDATAKRKQELIEQGLKPYNKEEAEMYALRGWKYDGVPYIVYKNDNYFYHIKLIGGNAIKTRKIKFENTEYVNSKLRGKGFKQLAAEVTSRKEIFNLDIDIKAKLNVLLEYDKMHYIKFIRGTNQVYSELSRGNKFRIKRVMYDEE